MAAIHETAYPRLKSELTDRELDKFYTPNGAEQAFAKRHTRKPNTRIGLLSHLKVFQRLGYFVLWDAIPSKVPQHIAACLGVIPQISPPINYDESGTRTRHLNHIRNFMKVESLGDKTIACLKKSAWGAVQSKEKIPDIINVMIEELIRQGFELPGFSTLDRAAYQARFKFNEQCFEIIADNLTTMQISKINQLLKPASEGQQSWWNLLKLEPEKPTTNNVKYYSNHVDALSKWEELLSVKIVIPTAKYEQFCHQAYAANLTQINRLVFKKRHTYAVLLVQWQTAKAVDNLVHLFIRHVHRIHNNGKQALNKYHLNHREQVEILVEQLLHLTQAFQGDGTPQQRLAAMEACLADEPKIIVEQCEEHLAHSKNDYLQFLPKLYKSKRYLFFNCLVNLKLKTSSQDQPFFRCVEFLKQHQYSRKEFLETRHLELNWITDKWRKLVTGKTIKQPKTEQVNRRYFELCVFTELARQLDTGDIYIQNSLEFDDYRQRFISWKVYHLEVENYETISGIPTNPSRFIAHLKNWMLQSAQTMDDGFPDNQYVRMENGELVISPTAANQQGEGHQFLEDQFKSRMHPIGILDILTQAEKWLHLSQNFGQLSGYQPRIDNYPARFVSTLFCYGCNFGPAEAARSIPGVSRKQLAWINAQHVTEKRLDKAIVQVINQYNKFQLPAYWGTGKSASADGTKWNLYEQNLLSEYHIRYGEYGGIAYYHVSDTYIALFSHFIPCGVYEALYILDGLMKNKSDIQPNTLHGDTHSQSFPVFGLAYLLGIQLMPRIKKSKIITMYRPGKTTAFQHINEIFGDPVNWNLIETHLPDMLRVALSIKAGKITPSAILKRLGTNNRKNKLYYAFRELGRAVRTGFLTNYYHDSALRKTINAATNKSEEFNNFAKWIAFANHGMIRENLKHEQTKVIKYNHLVANLLILYNTQQMTRILKELKQEGYEIKKDTLQGFSPYRMEHMNRYGSYHLNMELEVPPLYTDFELFV